MLDLKLGDSSSDADEWGGWSLAEAAQKSGISSIIVTGNAKYARARRAYKDFNAIDFFSKTDFPDINSTFVQRVQEAVDETEKRRQGQASQHSSDSNINFNDQIKSRVFISYSHKDRRWLERFKVNLKVLERATPITIWDDTKIKSGTKWREEIRNALESAKIAILLVTPEFLASDFINNEELPFLFKAAKNNGLQILWVAIKPSLYEETYICEFQSANNPSRPLASLPRVKAEEEIIQICKKVKEAANL